MSNIESKTLSNTNNLWWRDPAAENKVEMDSKLMHETQQLVDRRLYEINLSKIMLAYCGPEWPINPNNVVHMAVHHTDYELVCRTGPNWGQVFVTTQISGRFYIYTANKITRFNLANQRMEDVAAHANLSMFVEKIVENDDTLVAVTRSTNVECLEIDTETLPAEEVDTYSLNIAENISVVGILPDASLLLTQQLFTPIENKKLVITHHMAGCASQVYREMEIPYEDAKLVHCEKIGCFYIIIVTVNNSSTHLIIADDNCQPMHVHQLKCNMYDSYVVEVTNEAIYVLKKELHPTMYVIPRNDMSTCYAHQMGHRYIQTFTVYDQQIYAVIDQCIYKLSVNDMSLENTSNEDETLDNSHWDTSPPSWCDSNQSGVNWSDFCAWQEDQGRR